MKKMKIMLGSAAFLVAVVAAFASKSDRADTALIQYYWQNPGTGLCETTNCSPLNNGQICDFTVYQQKISDTDCSNPVTLAKRPQ